MLTLGSVYKFKYKQSDFVLMITSTSKNFDDAISAIEAEVRIAVTYGNNPKTERYLVCDIKDTGCSHFTFGDPNIIPGYLHMCGQSMIKAHVALLEWIYKLIYKEAGFTENPWED